MTSLKHVAATGVGVSDNVFLRSVIFTAGASAGTVEIRDSSDGTGTVIFKLGAAAGSSNVWLSPDDNGVRFKTGIHLTLSNGEATIEYVK